MQERLQVGGQWSQQPCWDTPYRKWSERLGGHCPPWSRPDKGLLSRECGGPNPPPNLVGVPFVVLQDVFVVDSASHMLRLGRREGFGRRF